MFVGALFKWWTLMVTPESGSFPKGKKPKNLLPSVIDELALYLIKSFIFPSHN